jgi:hypothetical protein
VNKANNLTVKCCQNNNQGLIKMGIDMRKIINTMLLGTVALFAATSASAAIVFPALELNPVTVSGTASGITMTGVAPYTLSDNATILTDLNPDLTFSLTSDAAGAGTLQIDGGSALSATFSNLSIVHSFGGGVSWNADLTYTGGSLTGSMTGGRVEGGFAGVSGFTMGQSLLGQDFSASGGIAKIGAVVPIPPAVWLFGSGLLGMAGVARRKSVA